MRKILIKILALVFIFVFSFSFCFAQQSGSFWSGCNEGSWVLYRLAGGLKQKQTLIGKSPTELTIKTEVSMKGNAISSNEVKIPLNQSGVSQFKQLETREYSDKVSVKGRSLSCKVFEVDTPQGKARTWISDKVPGGIVKSAVGDNVSLELIDYEVK